jgi:hypothetical protein
MRPFARRFRLRAGLIVLSAVVALIAIVALAIVLLSRDDYAAGFTCLGGAIAVVVGAGALAAIALPRSRALRQVSAANPEGAVFLGRRQPSPVSDLVTFVGGSQELLAQVSDRWVVSSIDARGMAAWSVEPVSRELLLIPWAAIGYVERVDLEGDPRHGIAVDVKPFPTPLVVAVGYAAFGVLAPFRRRGVLEVIAATEALRPASD